ncbi:branched-chain amino acid ABC transporter ATP-binding protein [Rhodopseudomonas sp. AAP120]|uniref:ABC transporter ATP-binding protein n=1 Tax=Rhodopseudomonas sp. AAP120 TaxID=1523430 RepID=UPI0006B9689F|nr:ABC transporter ATP-binding protein [Rhodopseudomonas sp. AAP120]KPF97593.1 branched-chain amino acid ABC transporter ATP-binding protein [Rhodopseudomonas sp. AAP120]
MSELLRLTGVSRRFSGLQALRDVNLSVARGEVLGLIGPNGAGKTTLVNTICGVTPANTGTVLFDGKDITRIKTYQAARLGLSRTFQIVQPFAEFSALDNVAAAALFSQPGASLKSAREAAREHLAFVGLEAQAEQSAATLTLAMRKRLELAKALAMKPKLLFLDEVNAGLNSAEVERATKLIHQLAAGGITIVMIEHLMKVALNVCTRIVVLHNGHPIADGPPREVISNPAVVEAYLGQQYAQRTARHG